jgi:hypothetical protein
MSKYFEYFEFMLNFEYFEFMAAHIRVDNSDSRVISRQKARKKLRRKGGGPRPRVHASILANA